MLSVIPNFVGVSSPPTLAHQYPQKMDWSDGRHYSHTNHNFNGYNPMGSYQQFPNFNCALPQNLTAVNQNGLYNGEVAYSSYSAPPQVALNGYCSSNQHWYSNSHVFPSRQIYQNDAHQVVSTNCSGTAPNPNWRFTSSATKNNIPQATRFSEMKNITELDPNAFLVEKNFREQTQYSNTNFLDPRDMHTTYRVTPPEPMRQQNENYPQNCQPEVERNNCSIIDLEEESDEGSFWELKTEDDEEHIQENFDKTTYVNYVPKEVNVGRPHPSEVVESESLSCVDSPKITYRLSLPETVFSGQLSNVQVEAVTYACQAHCQRLPSGKRMGFLLGDGVGLGKGRTIAGIVRENWIRGEKRALWVSASKDLELDARRDLDDIGAPDIPIISITTVSYSRDVESQLPEGVLFATYSSLISSKTRRAKYNSRYKQIANWLGPNFNGLVIFDESHRARRINGEKCKDGNSTGKVVLRLQEDFPNARIVYASATMACDPNHLGHMARLGLWDSDSTFKLFKNKIENLNMMEMVSMELKQRGVYLARRLSFKGVQYETRNVELSKEFLDIYERSCALWTEMIHELLNNNDLDYKSNSAYFWGAHQSFFRSLCIAAKVESVIEMTNEALSENCCVVIGLQLTGEAQATDLRLNNANNVSNSIVSPAKYAVERVLKRIPELRTPKVRQLFEAVANDLPRNTLDVLIERLGGESKVAEMTGRRRTSNIRNVNIIEKEEFMNGDKVVAVISDAASTGISLQSDRRARNQKKRVHICIELPWSADASIQQMGRTHRSNQVVPPKYICPVTDIAGEKRFAWGLAKKLEKLGALTQSDRRMQGESLQVDCNLHETFANEAVEALLSDAFDKNSKLSTLGGESMQSSLKKVGLVSQKKEGISWQKFMNRLLGLPPSTQTLIFDVFQLTYRKVIAKAIEKNHLKFGSNSLIVSSLKVLEKIEYNNGLDRKADERITLQRVELQLGMTWVEAKQMLDEQVNRHPSDGFYEKILPNSNCDVLLFLYDHERNVQASVGPGYTGHERLYSSSKIPARYNKIDLNEAQRKWNFQYEALKTDCRHKFEFKRPRCPETCNDNKIFQEKFIVTGSVLSITEVIDIRTTKSLNIQLKSSDKKDEYNRFIGLDLDASSFENLKEHLDEKYALKPETQYDINSSCVFQNSNLTQSGTSFPIEPVSNAYRAESNHSNVSSLPNYRKNQTTMLTPYERFQRTYAFEDVLEMFDRDQLVDRTITLEDPSPNIRAMSSENFPNLGRFEDDEMDTSDDFASDTTYSSKAIEQHVLDSNLSRNIEVQGQSCEISYIVDWLQYS